MVLSKRQTIWTFVSKISQELLGLEFWNLIQTSGMTSCIKELATYCLSVRLFVYFSFVPIMFSIISARHLWALESSNFVYMTRMTKCITENKTKVPRFILPTFSIFSFSISHSNKWIWKFSSKFSQELQSLGFWNLKQTLGMTSCIV